MEENKPLAPFTSFGIGGPARWFVEADTEAAVVEATQWARQHGVPVFVLGGGSNLLVSDNGFEGLVLRIALRGIEVQRDGDEVLFRVAAGEDWDAVVDEAVAQDCAGLECLAGIPGTVGGTPVQNVGAYGQEVSSTIVAVRAFDLTTFQFLDFTNRECAFAYRRSRFNTVEKGRYAVTRVDYALIPGGEPNLRYADLQRAFPPGSRPALKEVAAAVRKIRDAKGMLLVDGNPDCRSAGSFFKNPIVPEQKLPDIAEAAGEKPPVFPAGDGMVKVPAAWLIERADFHKGFAIGRAGISTRHTLALVNRGGATAAEIVALAEEIARGVERRFKVQLEMEPVKLGF